MGFKLAFTLILASFSMASGILQGVNLNTLQDQLRTMLAKLGSLEQSVMSLQRLKQNVTGGTGTSLYSPQPVAFTAHLSKTIVMKTHQQIVFDNVITNVGNAYNPINGHFTAPVSGTYAFFLTVTNVPGHSASLVLVKNGQGLSAVLAHSSPTTSVFDTSTITTMLNLAKGDQVWAQVFDN